MVILLMAELHLDWTVIFVLTGIDIYGMYSPLPKTSSGLSLRLIPFGMDSKLLFDLGLGVK